YGSLVMAVGSKANFFNTPGAAEHALTLVSTKQAERFRLRLLHELTRATDEPIRKPLQIAIVGGGATGVELAAELMEASDSLRSYGMNTLDPARDIQITLLEGADRILSALPEKLSARAEQLLRSRGVQVCTRVKVAEVHADHLLDSEGRRYEADLCVWAAGIK